MRLTNRLIDAGRSVAAGMGSGAVLYSINEDGRIFQDSFGFIGSAIMFGALFVLLNAGPEAVYNILEGGRIERLEETLRRLQIEELREFSVINPEKYVPMPINYAV